MTKKDFSVGQEVYLLTIGYGKNAGKVKKGEVTKIGRRYIRVRSGEFQELAFDMLENFIEYTPYSPEYKLFLSEEEATRHVERMNLPRTVVGGRIHQPVNHLTDDELHTVKEIFERAKARKENGYE